MTRVHANFRYVRSALLLSTALCLMPTMTFAQDTAVSGGLENIVVTAQKRAENLQVVPVAVTAVSRNALEAIRFENVSNLNGLAPGLSVRNAPGGAGLPAFTMRGIYGTASGASDAAIALYIDGLAMNAHIGADFDLADVERVEVLRGPQGTLFGRGATGGAVNVITAEPTGEFRGRQQFSVGNLGHFRSKTTVDFPAWGALAASVTYLHDERDGDVRNLGAGTVWDYGPATGGQWGTRVSPKTLGGRDTNSVGATLKLEPGSDIKAVYRFNYTHKKYSPEAVGHLTFTTGGATSAAFSGIWNNTDPAVRTPMSRTRPEAVNNWFSTENEMTQQSHSLHLTVPITDSVTVKNLFGYRKVDVNSVQDLSGLGGMYAPGGFPNSPLVVLGSANVSVQELYQEELQLNIDTRWVKTTIGYLHFYSTRSDGPFPNTRKTPFGVGLFQGPYTNFVIAPFGNEASVATTTADAVYMQNEIPIVDKLDLVLGGRYSWDRRGGMDNSPRPSAPGVPIQFSKSTPDYLVGLNYKLSDEIFFYAKLSTAFIAGGRLANVPFDAATAKSYEVGVKSDLLDRRLRVNLAAFTVKYDGVQLYTNPSVGCANIPGVALAGNSCVVNGGNERAKGFELEVTAAPVDGLTLGGQLAYTDASLSKVDPRLRAADGTFVLIYTPKWTAALSAQYRGQEIDSLRGAHPFFNISATYTSSTYGFPNSLRAVTEANKIPSQWLVDARVGLGGFQAGGTEIELAAFAKNLTDDKSVIYDFNASTNIPGQYQPARTYGLDMTIGF